MKPQDYAQYIKSGRWYLITRNSATLADTDYEHIAKEIVDALNKRLAYPKMVQALKDAAASMEARAVGGGYAIKNLLREIGEDQ